MALVLKKENLAPWLAKLASSRRLIAPVDVEGKTLFRAVTSPDQIKLDYDNTLMSPKEWFFPQTDTMLKMKLEGTDVVDLTSTIDETPQVLFGLRPCDARSVRVLDEVFLSAPVDSYYEARRRNTTLIGLACEKPSAGCFCTSVGTGPDDASNVDVMLTEVDAGYIVEPRTDKGQAVIADAVLDEVSVEKPAAPVVEKLPTENLTDAFWKSFDADLWQKVSDRCLGCRACTFLCPTCYCFNVRDYEGQDGEVSRLRGWDSCQGATFYKLAGGHNPRPNKTTRLRQRFYHKLLYIPDRFHIEGCVGCGRCVVNCPVNIDIREVITKVVEYQEKASVESVSA